MKYTILIDDNLDAIRIIEQLLRKSINITITYSHPNINIIFELNDNSIERILKAALPAADYVIAEHNNLSLIQFS